jgi:16S rRNA (guanine527-N7)-methyltransferase
MRHQSETGALIQEACTALTLRVNTHQQQQLLDYLNELLKWNKTYNLTAIRDPQQALIHHVFDSLSIVGPIQSYLADQGVKQPTILDVGSGAGLPGVVLAVMLPAAKITCVDAVEKKTSFIRQAASVLKLDNLSATHARVEQLNLNKYDVVTSRAFASLEDFVTLAGDQALPTGVLLAMKGKRPDDEIQQMHNRTQWNVTKTDQIAVPQLNAERCLLWIKRKEK